MDGDRSWAAKWKRDEEFLRGVVNRLERRAGVGLLEVILLRVARELGDPFNG